MWTLGYVYNIKMKGAIVPFVTGGLGDARLIMRGDTGS